jgi:hypothetical protein
MSPPEGKWSLTKTSPFADGNASRLAVKVGDRKERRRRTWPEFSDALGIFVGLVGDPKVILRIDPERDRSTRAIGDPQQQLRIFMPAV